MLAQRRYAEEERGGYGAARYSSPSRCAAFLSVRALPPLCRTKDLARPRLHLATPAVKHAMSAMPRKRGALFSPPPVRRVDTRRYYRPAHRTHSVCGVASGVCSFSPVTDVAAIRFSFPTPPLSPPRCAHTQTSTVTTSYRVTSVAAPDISAYREARLRQRTPAVQMRQRDDTYEFCTRERRRYAQMALREMKMMRGKLLATLSSVVAAAPTPKRSKCAAYGSARRSARLSTQRRVRAMKVSPRRSVPCRHAVPICQSYHVHRFILPCEGVCAR